MIRIIAILCRLSAPTDCHSVSVTNSDMADISMQSCLMGAPQLAEFMRSFPQYRLASWKCQIGVPEREGA